MKEKAENKTKALVRKLTGLDKEFKKKFKEVFEGFFALSLLVEGKHSKRALNVLSHLRKETKGLVNFFQDHSEGFREPTLVEYDILNFSLWGFFDSLEFLLTKKKKDWETIKTLTESFSSLLAYILSIYLKKKNKKVLGEIKELLDLGNRK